MNGLKIRINGTEISLENTTPAAPDHFQEIQNMSAAISNESDVISKQIKAVTLLSDIKTVESFGYTATESVGNAAAAATNNIKDRLVAFFKRIALFFQKIGQNVAIKIATLFKNQAGKDFGNTLKEVSAYGFKLSQEGVKLSSDNTPDVIEQAKQKQAAGAAVVSCVSTGIKLVAIAKNKDPNDKTIEVILANVSKLLLSITTASNEQDVIAKSNEIKDKLLKQFIPAVEKAKDFSQAAGAAGTVTVTAEGEAGHNDTGNAPAE